LKAAIITDKCLLKSLSSLISSKKTGKMLSVWKKFAKTTNFFVDLTEYVYFSVLVLESMQKQHEHFFVYYRQIHVETINICS